MSEDEKRYARFLEKWGDAFKKTPSILKTLNSYPDLCKKIKFVDIENLDHLHQIQREWIWLISRFDNPVEITFFKEYFVPIDKIPYKYFIDLSPDGFSIFLMNYYQFEPIHWYKSIEFNDVGKLLYVLENEPFDVEAHFKEFWLHQRMLVNDKVEHSELLQNPNRWKNSQIDKNDLIIKGNEDRQEFT